MNQTDFDNYLTSIFQDELIMLSVGLGHDLGLFKVMCEASEPISAEEVSEMLDLKVRYTKEWFTSMVAAGIVVQDRDSNLYTIPEQFKDIIMAKMGFAPILFSLGKRSDLVKATFKKNGPYGISFRDKDDDEAAPFIDWMNGYKALICDQLIDNKILRLLAQQGMVSRLESGIKVLDLGCGTGSNVNAFAQRFPKSTFFGLDYSESSIRKAEKNKQKRGLTNVTFITGDAHYLPDEWTESFDYVFVYYVLHDLPDPHKALGQIYKILRKDGFLSIIDLGFHSNPVDNANDKGAALYFSASIFVCLQCSMSEAPHIGYGATWGKENIEKALLDANFKIKNSSMIEVEEEAFFLCSKEK